MRTLTLTIPGAVPSKGNSYRIATRRDGTPTLVRGKRHAGSRDAATFDCRVLNLLIAERVRPLTGPVKVTAAVYAPDERADIPGCEKALLDALQNWRTVARKRVRNPFGAGAYENDRQVRDFRAYEAGIDPDNPRVVVTVEPLPDVGSLPAAP